MRCSYFPYFYSRSWMYCAELDKKVLKFKLWIFVLAFQSTPNQIQQRACSSLDLLKLKLRQLTEQLNECLLTVYNWNTFHKAKTNKKDQYGSYVPFSGWQIAIKLNYIVIVSCVTYAFWINDWNIIYICLVGVLELVLRGVDADHPYRGGGHCRQHAYDKGRHFFWT